VVKGVEAVEREKSHGFMSASAIKDFIQLQHLGGHTCSKRGPIGKELPVVTRNNSRFLRLH